MNDIDHKVVQYTLDFSKELGLDIDPSAITDSIVRHLSSARKVVTNETLERIGHQHLAVMINTAARYDLSLAEVMNMAVKQGVQPVSSLCKQVRETKEATKRISRKPSLTLIKG
jgi:hypothetical protein